MRAKKEPEIRVITGHGGYPLTWDLWFVNDVSMATPLELDWAMFRPGQLRGWAHWPVLAGGTIDQAWLDPLGGWQ
jgi:hypothetical protein